MRRNVLHACHAAVLGVVLLLVAPAATPAQIAPFPLAVGNRWVYRHSIYSYDQCCPDCSLMPTRTDVVSRDTLEWAIVAEVTAAGQRYFQFSTGVLLRADSLGNIWEYNDRFAGLATEMRVLDFASSANQPDGGTYAYVLPYDERYPARGGAVVLAPSPPAWMYRAPTPSYARAPEGVPAEWFEGSIGFGRGYGWEWARSMVFAPDIGLVLASEGEGCGPTNEYALIEATVCGRVVATAAAPETWGRLKQQWRYGPK
jgi:hypothetical protein